ncbi:MAG: DDE-type integrase/transposase/recombinase [Patescibacteria group bacterium]
MTIAREKKTEIDAIKKTTKTELAESLGISCSSLYYQPKRPALDLELKAQIESVLVDNPLYGHKRIALELKMNKKRIRRVMKKFNLKPYRRRSRKPNKKEDVGKEPAKYQNLIKGFCPIRPNVVWISDFTYLSFQGRFIYLATIIDLFTREIISFNVSRFHNKELTIGALLNALDKTKTIPIYLHSDQGSEYTAIEYTTVAEREKIQVSMSKKATPAVILICLNIGRKNNCYAFKRTHQLTLLVSILE